MIGVNVAPLVLRLALVMVALGGAKCPDMDVVAPEMVTPKPEVKKPFGENGKILMVYLHGYGQTKHSIIFAKKDVEKQVEKELGNNHQLDFAKFEEWTPDGDQKEWFPMDAPAELGKKLCDIAKAAGAFQNRKMFSDDKDFSSMTPEKKEEYLLMAFDGKQADMIFAMRFIGEMWPYLDKSQEASVIAAMQEVLLPRIQAAVQRLNPLIDQELAQRGIPPGNLVLAGHSQGAMMALAIGLQRDSLAIFSDKGMLVPGIVPTHKPRLVKLVIARQDEIFYPEVVEITLDTLRPFLGKALDFVLVHEKHTVGEHALAQFHDIFVKVAKKHKKHHGQ